MVTMSWKKDAAGRLASEWKSGAEKAPAHTVYRYRKTARKYFQTYLPAKSHQRKKVD